MEGVENSIRIVFALLDIRLVERVNAKDMSGDGRRKFPPEELSTHIIAITEVELENRMFSLDERVNRSIERLVLVSFEFEIDEEAVGSIGTWGQNRFLCDGDEACALFTRTFSQQLLDPEPERRERW